MFASLKNKIREEIGSDVSTVVRNAANIRSISSRHISQTGSTSSISESQTSLDGSRDEHVASSSSLTSKKQDNNFPLKLSDSIHLRDIKNLDNQEEEWQKFITKKELELQKKIDKINEEWKNKLSEKEKEWKKTIEKQEKNKIKLETELQTTESSKRSLELALRDAEEYKKKLYNFQEDAEQLESYQTQEMAKIKHLLLSKEQEVEEKSQHLKVALAEIESLKSEVSRLRRYEDDLNNIQETSSNECSQLKSELEETTEKLLAATSELTYLRSSNEDMRSNNSSLHLEINLLKESLENEKRTSAKLQEYIEKEKNEKDSALLRSAQFSQDIEIIKQEQRLQEVENHELQNKMDNLEDRFKAKSEELEKAVAMLKNSKQRIIELEEVERNKEKMEENEKILLALEEQINEKTKTIKVLKQRLTDMKKTLQRELRVPSASLDNDAEPSTAILNPSSSKTVTAKHVNLKDDVNFKYLKHVLIKFLTSREYEALHLTKAVATLLHFSPEEERLLQQTLEWKMSWFGTRPNLGFGQTAKAIPPS
ncbi:PREDICTED: golgin subfamily A member 1 isoform X3 [Polistes canadensis]|uniref:golgin subfamily A member 1 isoform X3 n=1 Tax=Polistes canadensis TaxID=91411 RepID=UPI000718F5C4|nr:PREDICTED: golgin subfamily A member 1 isoform X3 [Polistes canadensis]